MAKPPAFAASLQPASWRGLKFNLTRTDPTDGRRVFVHEYPYRDEPFVEDLGRATRYVPIEGYIWGDDVFAQRDALKKACAQSGAGTLVHPSLGTMQATLITSSFGEIGEDGNVVYLSFNFVVSKDISYPNLYPAVSSNTPLDVKAAAANLKTAASGDFLSNTISALKSGATAVQSAVSTVTGVVSEVQSTINSVIAPISSTLGMAGSMFGQLTGNFSLGRFAGQLLNNPISSALSGGLSALNSVGNIANSVSNIGSSIGNISSSVGNLGSSLGSINSLGSALSTGVSALNFVNKATSLAVNTVTNVRSTFTQVASSVKSLAAKL